jgi:hypothetical protein
MRLGWPGMFSIDYPYESSHEAVKGFERTTLSAADREKIAHGKPNCCCASVKPGASTVSLKITE